MVRKITVPGLERLLNNSIPVFLEIIPNSNVHGVLKKDCEGYYIQPENKSVRYTVSPGMFIRVVYKSTSKTKLMRDYSSKVQRYQVHL